MRIHQGRGPEKGAHKGHALHAVTKFRLGGFSQSNSEAVYGKDLDLFTANDPLRRFRKTVPEFFAFEFALDDKHTLFTQSRQGVGMQKDIRIGRQHHADVFEFAIQAQGLFGQHGVEGRRLAFLFRTVFRVGLDVHAQQFGRGHRQVLAHGNGAPATHGMNADFHGIFGKQVQIPGRRQRQVGDMRVIGQNLFLPDLHFGQACIFLNKIKAEVKLTLPSSILEHVLNRGDNVARLQVTAAQAKAAGIEIRNLIGAQRGQARIRPAGIGAIAGPAVFSSLGHGRTDFANHR